MAPLCIPFLDLPDVEPELETASVRDIRDAPQPFLMQYYGYSTTHSVERPLSTATTIKKHAHAQPVIVLVNHGNGYQGERGNHRRAHSIDQPLPTITIIRNLGLA